MDLKSAFKLFGKILLGIFLFLLLIALFTLTTVDRSPLDEQDFYQETFTRLDQLSFEQSIGDGWMAGWGKSNMTPKKACGFGRLCSQRKL